MTVFTDLALGGGAQSELDPRAQHPRSTLDNRPPLSLQRWLVEGSTTSDRIDGTKASCPFRIPCTSFPEQWALASHLPPQAVLAQVLSGAHQALRPVVDCKTLAVLNAWPFLCTASRGAPGLVASQIWVAAQLQVDAQSTSQVAAPSTSEVAAPLTSEVAAQSTSQVATSCTSEVAAPSTSEVATQSTNEVAAQSRSQVTAPSTSEVAAPSMRDVATVIQ